MPAVPTLLFAQAAVPLVSRAELRWEFANIAAAVALLSIALAAIALFFFRRSTRDLTLIFFGLFCALYAARLLASVPSFRFLFNESRAFWGYLDWIITCTIILPFGLFLYQLVDERLRSFVRWLIAVQAIFAVYGILAAALGAGLRKLYVANNILVLATFVALALFLVVNMRHLGLSKGLTREIRVFIAGFAVWILFIVRTNLVGLRVLRGYNVEFIGSWFSSRASDTSPRIASSPTKNASSPSTKNWKSRARFNPPRSRGASPPSQDSKSSRATSP